MKNILSSHDGDSTLDVESLLTIKEKSIEISFLIKGVLAEYIFPPKSEKKRANELWKATCFELFLANSKNEAYYELNFSSSLAWNFYVLDSYRAEPKELELFEEPIIYVEQKNDEFFIIFELELSTFNFEEFKYYNLATILLNKENKRTFWAIKHLKTQPDFHDKKSFLKI